MSNSAYVYGQITVKESESLIFSKSRNLAKHKYLYHEPETDRPSQLYAGFKI